MHLAHVRPCGRSLCSTLRCGVRRWCSASSVPEVNESGCSCCGCARCTACRHHGRCAHACVLCAIADRRCRRRAVGSHPRCCLPSSPTQTMPKNTRWRWRHWSQFSRPTTLVRTPLPPTGRCAPPRLADAADPACRHRQLCPPRHPSSASAWYQSRRSRMRTMVRPGWHAHSTAAVRGTHGALLVCVQSA